MEKNPLRVYNNVLEMIGSTPMLKINKLAEVHKIKCQVYIKLEGCNPGESIKDRIGLNMIEKAEEQNLIKKGQHVIESTSGNTGMGVVLASIIKGYKPIITIPDKMSNEKVNRLKALGAEVHVCPTEVDAYCPEGYKGLAKLLTKKVDGYYPDQYTNPANPDIHYRKTGLEIYE